MNATASNVVGVDPAKNVFQIYWIEPETGEIRNVQIKRAKFLEHFVNRAPCVVGMEACGGAQHWARELTRLGHEVVMMPAKSVKAYVTGNKSDAIDARAIWTAVRHGGIKRVAVKTESQQATLALHRMRQQLVKVRTMQINELRGLLTEYGEIFAKGRTALSKGIAAALDRLGTRLPQVVTDSLLEQWQRVGELDEQVAQIESRLKSLLKEDASAQRLITIPGVGLLTATAVSAAMGHADAFRSGREFAAWLGLVPAHTGTGGKTKMLGLSKRGDTYLRTLLIHGARSVLTRGNHPSAWQQQIMQRRPLNVVVVAMANKMARTIWALLKHGRTYQTAWVSKAPA
ncbi:IS110 family transposase [Variovorax sp. GT1P44]|uniref:IS110 family transposase n=1 Tax=Variovorax sp. GT1P44 TaxID=3443742 RepID=UPI003F4752E8